MKKGVVLVGILFVLSLAHPAFARSSKNMTIGIMAMGNIQLIDTLPDIDPGPGGGVYFDYRFNQRFTGTDPALHNQFFTRWQPSRIGDAGPSQIDNGINLFN